MVKHLAGVQTVDADKCAHAVHLRSDIAFKAIAGHRRMRGHSLDIAECYAAKQQSSGKPGDFRIEV